MSFVNKVVIVTGASSGIGAATAIAFAKEGASVVIVGRNEDKLNKVSEECSKVGNKPLSIKADITKEEEAERIVKETIETYGKLNILVNNAGLVRFTTTLDDQILNVYDEIMNTNLRAQVYLTHLAAPFLIKTKGNIVNISSIAGENIKISSPKMSMYAISKAAFTHFSRRTAAELAPLGVRVNTVSPGPADTDIMRNAGLNKSLDEVYTDMPFGKVLDSEEVSDIILYLASDKAKSITGSNYVIDGGITA